MLPSQRSISSRVPNECWALPGPYLTSTVSAAVATVPAYPFFAIKSALQMDRAIPKLNLRSTLLSISKGAPVNGMIVGTQMAFQGVFERKLQERAENMAGLKIENLSQTMKGISARSMAVGMFSLVFKITKELFHKELD